ncbi:MAG: hypothetical protein HC884_12325 [Chloroflexaceae bacterium]|nr:hypothetical protein [Chloroflexaceae bacterium]
MITRITLGSEAQKRFREALRRLDHAIQTDRETQEQIWERARTFISTFYQVFELIEQESLVLEEVLVKMQRIDDNQFEVSNKNYPTVRLMLDTELAYDTRPVSASQVPPGERSPPWVPELSARMFAIFSPPYQGLLRSYTIFADGSWKRTTFALGSGGVHAQSALVPTTNPNVLVLEAIDLLTVVCTHHPTWANLAAVADTLTMEHIRERSCVKLHLTGLGTPPPPER